MAVLGGGEVEERTMAVLGGGEVEERTVAVLGGGEAIKSITVCTWLELQGPTEHLLVFSEKSFLSLLSLIFFLSLSLHAHSVSLTL